MQAAMVRRCLSRDAQAREFAQSHNQATPISRQAGNSGNESSTTIQFALVRCIAQLSTKTQPTRNTAAVGEISNLSPFSRPPLSPQKKVLPLRLIVFTKVVEIWRSGIDRAFEGTSARRRGR